MENSELTKVILDVNGFPVPQYYSEENELYAVETTDGSLVLSTDINFALIPMLLDYNGFPIPQLWDPTLQAFVPRTTQNGGGSGGGDYTLPTATTTRLGGVKPDGVTVETDANGVLSIKDGAVAPIQSLVRSVNLILPDPITGDVDLPPIPPQEYRYVDVLSPLEPESEYEMGTTAFITYFERATMPEWAAIFDNPNVPDGDMMVVTHKYNNGVMHCIQMVDTFRDGEFKAQFSRQWDYTEDEWTPLNDISYVQSVNGIKPNVSGDITIPEATTTVKGIVQLASGHNASQNTRIPTVQVMNTAINQHANQNATTGVTGHVRVDGTTITVDANGIISATVGGNPVNLSDDYMLGDSDVAASTKATDELYSDMNANFVQLLEDFLEHQDTKGSSTEYGHIRVDGTTIISSNGVISAVGGGSGTPGPAGEDGKDGSKWFVSETEPVGGTTSDFWLNSINHFVYTFDGTNWTQTNTNLRGATWFKGSENPPYSLGHIADFYLNTTTYDIFQKHILSWTLIGNIKGADGDPLQIVDSFGVYDSNKALSVNMGSELNDLVQNLYSSLIAHMDLKASSTDLGHVKADGSTISIDANGVISANSASGFKIDNNIIPSQAPSTYDVGVTMSYIPVGHANNGAWLTFYGGYYANSIHASTFKMNFVVTTVKDATDKTTQTVKMYGNIPKTNFELTTATRTSNDDADTWMSPLATMPIQRNSGTPNAWKNALAGTLYYDHSGKGWFYKKFDGDNDISNIDWAPLVPTVLNVTDSPIPTPGEDFVYSAESVKEMFDFNNNLATTTSPGKVQIMDMDDPNATWDEHVVFNADYTFQTFAEVFQALGNHASKDASDTEYGHVKVDGVTITALDGVISAVAPVYESPFATAAGSPTSPITDYIRGINVMRLYTTGTSAIKQAWLNVASSLSGRTFDFATTGVDVITVNSYGVGDQTLILRHMPAANGERGEILFKANRLCHDSTWQSWRLRLIKSDFDNHANLKATISTLGHVKVDGTTISVNDGTISVPTANLTSRGVVQLSNSITSNTTVAATPNAVNNAIIAHGGVMASTTVLGHVKVDGTSIVIDANGVISSNPAAIPDATPTVKGITKLYTGVNNATDGAVTPLAVQGAINAHVSQRASTSIWGHVRVDGTSIISDNGTISFNKDNYVIVPYRWEFTASANATNVSVGTTNLTATQLYAQVNVYDGGLLMSKSDYTFTKTGDLAVLNFTDALNRVRKIFVIVNQIQIV